MTRNPVRRTGGYTLLELMVTMALASILLGMGASAFLSGGRKTAYMQCLADVSGLISKARTASSHLPAAMVVDKEERSIVGMTESVIQELHFEPIPAAEGESNDDVVMAMGIGGLTVVSLGGTPVADGHVGGGLRLEGTPINCGNYTNYDVTDGIGFEVWLKPSGRPRGSIVSKGPAFNLRFDGPERLHVTLQVDDSGGPEELAVPVPLGNPVRENEWIGVSLVYDRKFIVVSTDAGYGPVERVRHPETRALRPAPDSALLVGDSGFHGVVDDFRFSGVHMGQPIKLPQGVEVMGESQIIRFASGRLDADAHPGIVVLGLVFGERSARFEIGQNGVVQNVLYEGEESQTAAETPIEGSGSSAKEE